MELNQLIKNFEPRVWYKLSAKERVQACEAFCYAYLQDKEKELYEIEYRDEKHVYSLTGIDKNIKIVPTKDVDITEAAFDYKKREILINDYYFKTWKPDTTELLYQLPHELQHAIQQRLVEKYGQEDSKYMQLLKCQIESTSITSNFVSQPIILHFVDVPPQSEPVSNWINDLYALSLSEREAFAVAEKFGIEAIESLGLTTLYSYATLRNSYHDLETELHTSRENIINWIDDGMLRLLHNEKTEVYKEAQIQYKIAAVGAMFCNVNANENLSLKEQRRIYALELQKLQQRFLDEEMKLNQHGIYDIPELSPFDRVDIASNVERYRELNNETLRNYPQIMIEAYYNKIISIDELKFFPEMKS